jgi:hypothetical protein
MLADGTCTLTNIIYYLFVSLAFVDLALLPSLQIRHLACSCLELIMKLKDLLHQHDTPHHLNFTGAPYLVLSLLNNTNICVIYIYVYM